VSPIPDGQRLGMIANAQVFVAELFGGPGHLLYAGGAVAPRRMVVKAALQVIGLNEPREVVRGRRRDSPVSSRNSGGT